MKTTIILNTISYASANYGKNFTDVLLDNLFWLAIAATIIALLSNIIKRNIQGAVISLVLGAVISYLIKNPTVLETIGNNIGNLLF